MHCVSLDFTRQLALQQLARPLGAVLRQLRPHRRPPRRLLRRWRRQFQLGERLELRPIRVARFDLD